MQGPRVGTGLAGLNGGRRECGSANALPPFITRLIVLLYL
jgi:hypothetical protein